MHMDILVMSSCVAERALLADALSKRKNIRVKEVGTGRDAAESLSIATPSAIVIAGELADLKSVQFIRMVRSGVFGAASIPVIVLTDSTASLRQASVSSDQHTFYLENDLSVTSIDRILNIVAASPRVRVLLIEDNEQYSKQCADFLAQQFNIDVAANGERGLASWRTNNYDVVLLDLMLPDISGADILSTIHRERPTQPVVILTAYDTADKHKELVLAGASAFLSKGEDLAVAAKVIEEVLLEKGCDDFVERARQREKTVQGLATTIHAAQYNLRCGRAHIALQALDHAVEKERLNVPSDDDLSGLSN